MSLCTFNFWDDVVLRLDWSIVIGTFFIMFVAVPIFFGILRLFGFYTIVRERKCHVYVLFGRVLGIISEPGIHFLWRKFGLLKGMIVNLFGRCEVLDMSLDQQYLRSQPVNSEEGAPMGIGIWYEMYISDPLAYLFKNADPRGSLAANVSNSTVRCLSNMPLASMLESRHSMSQTVREEVSPQSHEWGYRLGSVYIRKVHFRDKEMIRHIEEKVVNRLRQVTSAIKQNGSNQVSFIASSAEKEAAVEFAKAGAIRASIVGNTLQKIVQDPDIAAAMFEILEIQKMMENKTRITMIPEKSRILAQLLGAKDTMGETNEEIKQE